MGLSNLYNDIEKGLFTFAIKEIEIQKEEFLKKENIDKGYKKMFAYACDKLIILCSQEGDTIERHMLLDYFYLKINHPNS